MDDFQPHIEDLISHIYCRIQPSGVHGVGVFAIRVIPKGTNIFAGPSIDEEPEKFIHIPTNYIFDNDKIPSEVKKIIRDFTTVHDGCVELSTRGLNKLNISYFLNHSNTPNIETIDGVLFIAMRDVEKGEELFSNYHTYTKEKMAYTKDAT